MTSLTRKHQLMALSDLELLQLVEKAQERQTAWPEKGEPGVGIDFRSSSLMRLSLTIRLYGWESFKKIDVTQRLMMENRGVQRAIQGPPWRSEVVTGRPGRDGSCKGRDW